LIAVDSSRRIDIGNVPSKKSKRDKNGEKNAMEVEETEHNKRKREEKQQNANINKNKRERLSDAPPSPNAPVHNPLSGNSNVLNMKVANKVPVVVEKKSELSRSSGLAALAESERLITDMQPLFVGKKLAMDGGEEMRKKKRKVETADGRLLSRRDRKKKNKKGGKKAKAKSQ
jgi:hypothetical protein